MPISRVRSVTDTSITFITPMPATTSDMPATPANSKVMVPSISLPARSISSWEMMSKRPGGICTVPVRYEPISPFAASMASSPRAFA